MKNRAIKRPTGARVFIRAPTMDDCSAFIAAVRRSRHLHRPWVAPKAQTRAQFGEYLKRFDGVDRHGFLVVHRQCNNDLVGVININDVIRGAFQSASLGYYGFSPYTGQGLMREGMQLVIAHAFNKLKLHRLEANIQPANHNSLALVKKCGFSLEGLSRRMLKVRGKWKDHERWALLAEDA